MSYNSKYTGEQVEGFLDQIANGEIGGDIIETDPIFSASPAASITDAKKTEWDNKQDKITDLDAIRSGAEKGATALQSVPSEYVTESELVWVKEDGEAGVRLKGTNGTATGNLAISAGDDKTASDGTAFASVASGDHAVAFGYGNTCAGRTTLAQGLYNIVNSKDSVAFGQRNLVNGDQAFAAGQQNEVTARLGVAIGYKNKATNTDSVAIGYQNTSSGSASVAMGDTCEAIGTSSTAMGYKTKATGAYTSTFGQNTQATNAGEVAMGLYNQSTTSTDASEQTLFSFGIGTSDTNRTNAFEIKKNGDVYIGDKMLSDFATTTELSGKVDKISGKQLSTEDFTTALKTKLEGLSNYDDTELSEALSTLRGDFDKLVSGDTTTAIKTFNEVIAFLDGIQDSQDLSSIIASIEQQIAGKMDKVTLATVATSGSYNDLSNKPTIPSEQVNADWNATSGKAQILNKPTIPSAVTESTVSGWGFTKNTGTYSKPSTGIPKSDLASAVQTSLGKADTALQSYTEQYKGTVTGVKINGTTKNPSSGVVDLGTVITSHQDISGKQDKLVSGTNIKTINGQSILGSGDITIEAEEIYEVDVPYYESSDIIGITTEMWNKLLVTPTISAKVNNTPLKITLNKTDLGMGNLLFYIGSSINFSTGAPLVVTVIFSGEGENFVGIPPNSCASTYSSLPISTSQLENDSNFISSDNLKTINGQSLVGSGDIEISGGSSSDVRKEVVWWDVSNGETVTSMRPNVVYWFIGIDNVIIDSFEEPTTEAYSYDVFTAILELGTSSGVSTSLTLPDYIRWANGAIPEIVADVHQYELSISRISDGWDSTYRAVLTPFKSV